MIHTAIRTKFVLLWMLLLSFLPLSVSAQEQVIEINMSNGAWHDWNNNPSNPYARSWFSTTHPQISICCIEGGTKTTDIRGKAITGANNISVHNGNYLSFYSAYGSYSDGEYEITVADGWHIKTVEFDFESSVDNNISVVLNGQAEVVSSSPGNIGHVSTTISNDDTYSVPFTVRKDTENGFAQTGNFYITVARDAGLMESYAALLIEAKTQLLGALKLANAVINVNSSQNLITSATQFSSPYTETLEGSTEALLDGNSTTFWHSKWADGSVPNHTHYLQVDLIEPTYNDIALTFTRRSNAINDHITLWSVYGSNNPYAAVEDWEFLSYLYTPYTSNTETITSLPFGVGGYQYLRFYIDGTTTGRGYGHIGEFQLNPASLEVDPNVSYLGKAIQLGLVVGQHNLINQNDIGWTEYNTLLAAHNALLAKFVYAFEVDDMYFKTNSLTERTAAISYRGNLYNTYADEYTGDVVIPESVIFSGYTYGITTIDEYAFAACSGLTSITIPNTITAIGNGAFYGCTSLTSVTVNQDTPLPITANTFTNCTNVTLHVPAGSKAAYQAAPYWQDFKEIIETGTDGSPIIVFADANVKAICVANWDTNGDGELSEAEAAAVTDLGEVFKKNSEITSFDELQYFTGLTVIHAHAFDWCTHLTTITLPNSVTTIGNYAFWECERLTTFVIPSSVTTILPCAFYGCGGLTSITIPSSVTSIGEYAFSYTNNLISITVEDGNTVYDSREGCNAIIETATNTLIQGCNSTVIPNTVTSIGDWAFRSYKELASITLPNGLTSIGEAAFSECRSLTSLIIPSSVTSIGTEAFSHCRGLVSISVEDGNPVYDSRNDCNAIIETASNTLILGIKNTIIPSTVTRIGDHAFRGNRGFHTITIPNSVTSIGDYAFYQTELQSLTLPNSLTTIGKGTYLGCDKLTSVSIPNSVTSIGDDAFNYCIDLTSVSVYNPTPLSINEGCFSNRANATLYVPKGSKAAYEAAAYWNEFKEIIEIEDSPIIVFADANVKVICVANWDTNSDGELSEVEAAAVTDLGEVFTGNEDISTFHELSYFTGLTAIGDSAFANCGLQEVTIPANVTLIDKTAFKACGLTTITIPSGVTSIGASAFYGCTNLASVTIPESVTTIGMSAFSHCSSLPAITIPEGVTTIGISAFSYCSSLTYVSIPSTVTRLNDFTFMGCNNITTVRSFIKSPSVSLLLGPLTFTSTTRNNATLYVPKGSKATYESQLWWQNFKHIVEMGGDVNDDGEITLADKVALINWLLLQDDDDAYDPLYDVNDDGKVDVRDALRILELIANPW